MKIKLPFETGQGQSGTSFIETIVAMALLAVISTLTAQYMKQVSLDNAESRARSAVDSESSLWLDSIERDLTFREMPKNNAPFSALCSGLCESFYLDRLARKTVDKSLGKYTVHYHSYCQDLPDVIKGKYEEKSKVFGVNQFDFSKAALSSRYGAGHPNRCMAKTNCPNGTYPQIVRTLYNESRTGPPTGLKIPIYPNDRNDADGAYRSVIPQLGDFRSTADRIIAASICTDSVANSTDRIIMETAFLSQDNTVRIKRREISVPRENLARAQIVPNE